MIRRPPVAESTEARSRASRAGRQKDALITKLLTFTVGAAAAIATSGTKGAVKPRWSGSRMTSKPIDSAWRASSAISGTEFWPTRFNPNLTGFAGMGGFLSSVDGKIFLSYLQYDQCSLDPINSQWT